MSRLVVNPGTPNTWEIQLKPGSNSLGRGEANDFIINDPSVSGSHCQIVVDDGSVALRDIGSTNGTFVGGARIQEHPLQHGSQIRLGGVEMVYYAAAGAPAAVPPPPPPATRAIKVSIPKAAPVAVPTALVAGAPPMDAPPLAEATALIVTRYCKYHPKAPARFLCNKCNLTYCDLCIQTTQVGDASVRSCRKCGTQVVPVQFRAAPQKNFYSKLPGAFAYPFKGAGVLILICATIAFSALHFIGGGLFGIFIQGCLYGFVFLFMQNIILTTTSDESEPLSFPEVSSLYGAAFQLAATVVASFWLTIALTIAKYEDVDIPGAAIMGSVILGGFYFPMALLAVAMKDTVMAANPLVVIPAILKAPGKYIVTVVLLLGVFGIRQLGNLISGGAGHVAMTTSSGNALAAALAIQSGLALVSVYLLTVTMRILGLFYNGAKQKLGWFSF